MTVGLLLITHNRIGIELLNTAIQTFGSCPVEVRALDVSASMDPEHVLEQARRYSNEVNSGLGVLVLTDCYGSTPSNIANQLLEDEDVRVVSGVSLPMLIRVMNYARLPLTEVASKAVSGGCEGIVLSAPRERRA